MARNRPKTVDALGSLFLSRRYTSSKYVRQLIDSNRRVSQFMNYDKLYSKKYNEFVKAYNSAIKDIEQRKLTTSRKRFTVGGESFEVGTSTKIINKKANFRQIHRFVKKLDKDFVDNYELGHKNISVLRTSIAVALSATEGSSEYSQEERKALLALYTIVQEIDKIDKINGTVGENKLELLNKLKDIAATGPNIKVSWKKDIDILRGISGSIEVEAEYIELNQFKGRLSAWVGDIFSKVVQGDLEAFKSTVAATDISNLQGSPTAVQDIEKLIVDIIDPKRKPKKASSSSSAKKRAKKSIKAGKTSRNKLKKLNRGRTNATQSEYSLAKLMGVLNQQLPEAVAANMESPRLNYRTGQFASSVRITDITTTAKGFPSIGYTYQTYPYQTFEPGYAQGSVERDPRKLIDKSIRDIAVQFAIGRFYTRRV